MSLRLHLILLALICLLPAIALLAMNQMHLREAREAEVRHEIFELAQADAGEVARVIEGGKQLLTALEQAPAIREHNEPLCSALLQHLRQEYPNYASIVALDPTGRSFCSSSPGHAVFAAEQGWFHDALTPGRFVIGGYEISPITHEPVLPMARPVVTADGSVLGVLVLSLSLDRLGADLAAKLPADSSVTLADGHGNVLLQVPGDAAAGGPLPPGLRIVQPPENAATADVRDPDDVVRIVAAVTAGRPAYGLRVLAARERQSAFAALETTTRNGLVLIVGSMVLAVLLAAFIARRFIQLPVRELLRTAERLRRGDYERRTQLTAPGSELGRIGQALNGLAMALEEREQDRRAAEAQLLEFANTLEHRVEERTSELAMANARLAAEAEQRQRAQAELAQAQKLDAIGQITGGVAHDFNNLLAAILGALEVAVRRVEDTRLKRLLAVAQQAAERGAKLTAHMLAFSRKQELVLRPVDVNTVVGGMSDMLRRTLGPMVRLELDLAHELWPAVADPVQLEVALLNLAVNARDAMPDGGVLKIRTRNVRAANGGALPAGDYAMVTVADTGHGMPPEIQAKAFEPFFTTKGTGKGTGLGLSMVYGFATQTGGTATIDSAPGKGTAVSLYLPRTEALLAESLRSPQATARSAPLRVLLVDDDRQVRTAVGEMLLDLGHQPVEAESGDAALALLRGNQDYDVLLADFAMPEMTGAQLVEAVATLRPDLPVVLMTGYARDGVRAVPDAHDSGMLMKPFTGEQLAAALSDATNSPEIAPPS